MRALNDPCYGQRESAEPDNGPPAEPRFHAQRAYELCQHTYPPKSGPGRDGSYPPRVRMVVQEPGCGVMMATPPGCVIHCEAETPETSRIKIRTTGGDHVCNVVAHASGPDDLTEETVAIASAIYWSWWRARDMHGEAPRE